MLAVKSQTVSTHVHHVGCYITNSFLVLKLYSCLFILSLRFLDQLEQSE